MALKILDELKKLFGPVMQPTPEVGGDLRADGESGAVRNRLRNKLDHLRRSLWPAPVWLIVVYLVENAVLMFALAKGFKWI